MQQSDSLVNGYSRHPHTHSAGPQAYYPGRLPMASPCEPRMACAYACGAPPTPAQTHTDTDTRTHAHMHTDTHKHTTLEHTHTQHTHTHNTHTQCRPVRATHGLRTCVCAGYAELGRETTADKLDLREQVIAYSCNPYGQSLLQLQASRTTGAGHALQLQSLWRIPTAAVS